LAKVNVIYHHYPHYRRPIMSELRGNGKHDYYFWGAKKDTAGIKAFCGDGQIVIRPLRLIIWKKLWFLRDYWPAVFDPSVNVVVVIGNPNMPASWLIAVVGRFIGKKVVFWGHGWLKKESLVRQFIRNFYFRLAHKVMVYGDRAQLVAEASGFPSCKVWPIYNSLDYRAAQEAIQKIKVANVSMLNGPQSFFADESLPVIICTARITRLCRFDLLLKAASQLKSKGIFVNILLVGDGPERKSLEEMVTSLSLNLNVHFYGACYDEQVLATLIYYSDLTVSPGKIGLTAIHSLTYGTPAITHGDLDRQMPEVEAIKDGKTGLLFKDGDAGDLANKINFWLSIDKTREQIRSDCQQVISEKWTPTRQRECIDACVESVLSEK